MNNYEVFYKSGGIEIFTTVEAKNRYQAKIIAANLFSKDSLLPDVMKRQITANNVTVKRLYKNKKIT